MFTYGVIMDNASFQILGNSRSLRLDNIENVSSHLIDESSIELPFHIPNNPGNLSSNNFFEKHYGKISIVALISIATLALFIKNFRGQTPPPKKYHVTGKAKTTVSFD